MIGPPSRLMKTLKQVIIRVISNYLPDYGWRHGNCILWPSWRRIAMLQLWVWSASTLSLVILYFHRDNWVR